MLGLCFATDRRSRMPKIIFFCPPAQTINGGVKYIFRMAETLRADGHEAIVFEQNAERPKWFPSTAPVVGQGAFAPNADEVYVLPEDQVQMLESFKDWPQRKVIYSQNHFYSAYRLEGVKSYSDYGIRHIICGSRTIYEHARFRHPKVEAHIVPCSVDPALFKPAAKKQKTIAFMPKKRMIEVSYIRDMFCFTYPQHRDWQWRELHKLGEDEVARAMGEADVFLALSRLEGFGLTPLEAMSAGCVVAGFTGIGGREYATTENGFWVGEDDFPACIAALKSAVELAEEAGAACTKYAEACQKTFAAYTPDVFRRAVKDVWAKILA